MSKPQLEGQTAIVTGANAGIGLACAQILAEHGAAVVVNYHGRSDGATELVARITEHGGKALAVRADVSDEAEVAELFTTAAGRFGSIDILVSNAGVQKDAAFNDMSLADWNATLSVDLTGAFLCSRAATGAFLRQGAREGISRASGKIIFVSSVHQRIPWGGHANYAAAKGGVDMLMQTVAQEFAPHRIRVNSVAPGAIRTAINKSVWSDPEQAQKLLQLIPYGRIGEVEDVSRAVLWLASDDSDYVTGTTLFIDGGMTLYPSFADNG